MLPLLKADVAGVCAAVVEDLGPHRAGPLQFWQQVSVQVVCLETRVLLSARFGTWYASPNQPHHTPYHVLTTDPVRTRLFSIR